MSFPQVGSLGYTLLGLGVLVYVLAGVYFLIQSWHSDESTPFQHRSPFEPLMILFWPALPLLRRKRRRNRQRKRAKPAAPSNTTDPPA